MSDAQGGAHTIIDSNERKAPLIFLAVDIGANQRADPGRVCVGNPSKVEDKGLRGVAADFGLKVEQIGNDQGSGQAKNAMVGPGADRILDSENFLSNRHAAC